MSEPLPDDVFELYDLRVEVTAPPGARLYCGQKVGDAFEVRGELMHFREDQPFSLYALAAILPLLPAKQRMTADADWMTTDAEVACPDPNCPSRLRITRIGTRRFRHSDTTAVPMPGAPLAQGEDRSMTVERTDLAPGYAISRVLKGGWHLAGGHGSVDRDQAIRDMAAFVEAGITTFDCADHYTGVEQLIGDFRRACPSLAPQLQVHTKYVPDLDDLPTLRRADVVRIIDRSLQRLGVERLDLVQFFWWDWSVPGAVDAALVLDDLRREGKIALLGVTNFSTDQFAELVEAGIPFAAHQLQYSIVDRRPETRMMPYCAGQDVAILTYGQLLGGFLSEAWLGKPEPEPPLANRSLTKYKLIIDEFGGWGLFQELLAALDRIARRHGVGIGEVALRWTLDRPGVAGCIVGATSTRHLARNVGVFDLRLTDADRAGIEAVAERRQGPSGDCYGLENDRNGPHGRIMRYNQNSIVNTAV